MTDSTEGTTPAGVEDPLPADDAEGSPYRWFGAEAAVPGHRHCKHGHTVDCPDPDNCDLID